MDQILSEPRSSAAWVKLSAHMKRGRERAHTQCEAKNDSTTSMIHESLQVTQQLITLGVFPLLFPCVSHHFPSRSPTPVRSTEVSCSARENGCPANEPANEAMTRETSSRRASRCGS